MNYFKLIPGKYHCQDSTLYVAVHKVHHQNSDYVKFKGSLIYKRNGMICEHYKNYKVQKKLISHWTFYLEQKGTI